MEHHEVRRTRWAPRRAQPSAESEPQWKEEAVHVWGQFDVGVGAQLGKEGIPVEGRP